jgi:hypothetical protein
MMFRSRSLASVLVCAAGLAARTAHADPSAADISVAKHAFETAVSLENESHWAEAELKLREAIAVKDTPGMRFHLAHCETEQGHLVEALADYERASDLLRHGAKAPDVQKLVGPASDALRARIARVSVELPPDLSAPAAAVDGRPYPPSELALGVSLNPGRHELRVSAAGRRSYERALLLKEGEQVALRPDLALSAPPSTTPAPSAAAAAPVVAASARPESPAHDGKPTSAKVYLLLGESALTVAGLVVGIGYQVSASSASKRIDAAQARIDGAAPNDVAACGSTDQAEVLGACSDLRAAISDHDHAIQFSSIGFVTAGVGAAALLTTWLVYPSARSGASGLSVQPIAGLGRIGLLGRF